MESVVETLVETPSGKLAGRVEDGIHVFRGIPYAKPPVGPLRFRAPEPAPAWKGVREAVAFGPSAPQNPMMLPLPGMDVGAMDEDCLYLNVYTPAPDGGRRPVLVWIHGGGFVIGSGSQSIYDGSRLARRGDVVVVTINYRLGPLGFLHLADLCPGLEDAAANCGIRDQVLALEWVRDHVGAFGGDPGNVTIFGESAGGMSVGTLLGTPSARGLFRRAIAQSGAAHNVHTRETATRVAEHFLERLGVRPAEAARALREMPPDKMLDTQQQSMLSLGTSLGLLLPFQPLTDGELLPVPPIEAVRAGSARGVSMLAGTTRDEWKLFAMIDPTLSQLDRASLLARVEKQVGRDAAEALVATYEEVLRERGRALASEVFVAIETDRVFRIPALRLAEAQLDHADDVFVYRFDWESPALGGSLGACHGVEIAFVFGVLDKPGVDFLSGKGPEADRLSETAMDAWLAFARGGDPSHAGLPGARWPRYDPERRATLVFGRACEVQYDPAERERRAWEGLL
jgi:para-nitrobenzyl esterase